MTSFFSPLVKEEEKIKGNAGCPPGASGEERRGRGGRKPRSQEGKKRRGRNVWILLPASSSEKKRGGKKSGLKVCLPIRSTCRQRKGEEGERKGRRSCGETHDSITPSYLPEEGGKKKERGRAGRLIAQADSRDGKNRPCSILKKSLLRSFTCEKERERTQAGARAPEWKGESSPHPQERGKGGKEGKKVRSRNTKKKVGKKNG